MATLRVKTVQMKKTVNAPLICSIVRREDASQQHPCAMEQRIVPMEMMKKIAVRYYLFLLLIDGNGYMAWPKKKEKRYRENWFNEPLYVLGITNDVVRPSKSKMDAKESPYHDSALLRTIFSSPLALRCIQVPFCQDLCCTVYNLLFCTHTRYLDYVTETFLLASSSVRNEQLFCCVHGQSQNL